MRCLIKQNELNGTCNKQYQEEIIAEGKKWKNADSLGNPWEVGMEDLQKAVDQKLAKGKGNYQQDHSQNGGNWKEVILYGGGIILIILAPGYLWKKFKG